MSESSERSSSHTLGFSRSSWRRAGHEGLWVLGGQASVALAGLIGMRVLTELAHKRVLGEVSLLMGSMGLVKGILVAPITAAQIRLHPEYAIKGQARWFEQVTSRWTWRAAGVAAVLLAMGDLIWNWTRHMGPWGAIMPIILAMTSLVDSIKSVQVGIMSARRRQARMAIWSGAEAWMWTAAAAIYLYFFGRTPESYLLGQMIGSYLALFIIGVLWNRRTSASDAGSVEPTDAALLRARVRAFALPLVPLGVVGWVTSLADRYILGGISGLADVGVYTAAYSLASRPILITGAALYNLARPILFQAASSGRTASAKRIFIFWLAGTVSIATGIVLLFAVFGGLIARLFLANEYRARAPALMIWVAGAYGMYNVGSVIETRLLSYGVSRKIVMPQVGAAVINTLANFLLIPRYGALGAAMATFFAYGGLVILMSASLWIEHRRIAKGAVESAA